MSEKSAGKNNIFHKYIVRPLGIILVLALLFVLVFRLNYVMRNKEYASIQDNFAHYKAEDVDIVFIGPSHCFCGIDPNYLADAYGIESFMLSTSAQTVPMSYYAAMEAIELKHPKKIVMEVSYCANDFRTVETGMSHAFFDGMPRCKARKLAIEDLIEKEDRMNYYFTLSAYHTRWKEMTEEDFRSNLTAPRGEYYSEDVAKMYPIPVVDPRETEPMPEEMEKYMDKLVDLCRENDTELILFCVPFGIQYDAPDRIADVEQRERIFNYIADYAKRKEVRYYNLFQELDNLHRAGLNDETDWKDTQHLNRFGQTKLTDYMASRGYFN